MKDFLKKLEIQSRYTNKFKTLPNFGRINGTDLTKINNLRNNIYGLLLMNNVRQSR